MAEDIVVAEQAQQTEQQVELAQNMAIALGLEQPQTAAETAVTETIEQVPVTFEIIKEKFGYEKPEDAVAEIEQLRAYKQQPVVEAPKFENEFNEKLYKAIQAGQVKEVTQLLAQQERLDSLTTNEVTRDTAADIIKLGMQLEFKTLTQAEIDYKYNKSFGIPKEPSLDVDDEDSVMAHNEWKEKVADIEMGKMIEAKMAIPKLEAAKSQIKLPDLPNSVDEGYTQYQKMLAEQEATDNEVKEAYKVFTPKSIETKIPFNDETNKIGFEFQYEPDVETFNKSVNMALDINQFFDIFKKSDGTPDRQGFLSAIHFALNKDKIITEAIKQAKNATLKSQLIDNSQVGNQRFQPQTQEPSELDKLMQAAVGQYVQPRR